MDREKTEFVMVTARALAIALCADTEPEMLEELSLDAQTCDEHRGQARRVLETIKRLGLR